MTSSNHKESHRPIIFYKIDHYNIGCYINFNQISQLNIFFLMLYLLQFVVQNVRDF